MSESGWPLLGDPIYGRPPRKGPMREIASAAGRTMLHSTHIEFTHPVTGVWMEFTRDPPEDFRRISGMLEEL
jgi:23S rRNA pseudouridine1911/1915/1917 synthase